MSRIKLESMHLHNFKCHKELEVKLSDGITKICGMNGVGKSSIFDAYLWTLFDRNAAGVNNPPVRPINADGDADKNIDVYVELTISVKGDKHVIRKTQKKVVEDKGNKNKYEIDGHPMIKREFNEFILKLLTTDDNFDLLSDPYAFMKLHWEKRREELTATQKDMSDVDIAKMFGNKYDLILPELKDFKTDDILKTHKRMKNDLVKKQDELKIRIDEASKRIVIADVGALEVEKSAKEVALQKVEDELSGGSSKLEEINAKREEVMKLKFHLSEIQNEENQKVSDFKKTIRDDYESKEYAVRTIKREIADVDSELKSAEKGYIRSSKEVERLKLEWKKEKSKTFPEFAPMDPLPESATVCPTCGQDLPEDVKQKNISLYEQKVREHEEKYENEKRNFEDKKEQAIKEINSSGLKAAHERNDLDLKIKEIKDRLKELNSKLSDAEKECSLAKEDLDKIPDVAIMSENTEYQATNEKISVLEKEIEELSLDSSGKSELEAKKAVLKDEIADISAKILAADNSKVRADIADYEEKVERTGQKIADQDHFIDLTEEFVRGKMKMISNKVNGLFHLVKWKLFQDLENGSVRETCVCTVDGVDYPDVNDGHKILAGLDIINTLSELSGVRLPIFIDRAGELNDFNLPKMDNQLILLKVTDDKELKIESEDK